MTASRLGPLLDRCGKAPHVTRLRQGSTRQVLVAAEPAMERAAGRHSADEEQTVSDLLTTATPGSVRARTAAGAGLRGERGTSPIVLGKESGETVGASVGDSVMIYHPQGDDPFASSPVVQFSPRGQHSTPAFTSTRADRLPAPADAAASVPASRTCCR